MSMPFLSVGLENGRPSGGAFDIVMGEAVSAWGFGPEAAPRRDDGPAPRGARGTGDRQQHRPQDRTHRSRGAGPDRRTPHSVLALQDAAVATSGDYRHWVKMQGRRLSHTMDPRLGARLIASPDSVAIVARTCAEADAWATALMVLGPRKARRSQDEAG